MIKFLLKIFRKMLGLKPKTDKIGDAAFLVDDGEQIMYSDDSKRLWAKCTGLDGIRLKNCIKLKSGVWLLGDGNGTGIFMSHDGKDWIRYDVFHSNKTEFVDCFMERPDGSCLVASSCGLYVIYPFTLKFIIDQNDPISHIIYIKLDCGELPSKNFYVGIAKNSKKTITLGVHDDDNWWTSNKRIDTNFVAFNTNNYLLYYDNTLFISEDKKTWYTFDPSEKYKNIIKLPSGRIIVATYKGIRYSDDSGKTFIKTGMETFAQELEYDEKEECVSCIGVRDDQKFISNNCNYSEKFEWVCIKNPDRDREFDDLHNLSNYLEDCNDGKESIRKSGETSDNNASCPNNED